MHARGGDDVHRVGVEDARRSHSVPHLGEHHDGDDHEEEEDDHDGDDHEEEVNDQDGDDHDDEEDGCGRQ